VTPGTGDLLQLDIQHVKRTCVDCTPARECRPDVLIYNPRMTAQILAAELGNLIQDSKRKNTELRNAAEKALQDLKSLSNTSEAQLSAGKQILPLPLIIAD